VKSNVGLHNGDQLTQIARKTAAVESGQAFLSLSNVSMISEIKSKAESGHSVHSVIEISNVVSSVQYLPDDFQIYLFMLYETTFIDHIYTDYVHTCRRSRSFLLWLSSENSQSL
jgi:hypothetical protein